MFEELNEEEYDERQIARRNDDFIVDDEGFGYKDRGGEIWEVNEAAAADAAKKKKRKLNVSLSRIARFTLLCKCLQFTKFKFISHLHCSFFHGVEG